LLAVISRRASVKRLNWRFSPLESAGEVAAFAVLSILRKRRR